MLSVPLRFSVSEEEQAYINVMSTQAMMSQSEYVRACLDDWEGRLNEGAKSRASRYLWHGPTFVDEKGKLKQKRRKREIALRITEEQKRKAKFAAEKKHVYWRTWVRMRVTGAPPPTARRRIEGKKAKRGRPSGMERFREELVISGQAMKTASFMNSLEALRVFYASLFERLKSTGLSMGDERALMAALDALISFDYVDEAVERSSDPNVAVPTRRRLIVKAYSPRYGVVEIAQPTPEDRRGFSRSRKKILKQEKTLRL